MRALVGAMLVLGAAPLGAQQAPRPIPDATPDATPWTYEWTAARYELTLLDDDSGPWQYGSLEAGMRRPRLTPVGRVNVASRNDEEGVQLEADLYPVWPNVGYAYLSGAWSAGAPFPELRGAGELFVALPADFEASAGLIYMDFSPGDVTIYVGSLSKYIGNYWLSARPGWTDSGDEFSLTLLARRYLDQPDEFVTVRLLYGTTPETLRTTDDVARLESRGMQADAQLFVAPRWLLLPIVSVMSEQVAGGSERLRASAGVGAMYRF